MGHRTVYYTPKGEEWRIPDMKLVWQASGKSGGWNEHLLAQNDWWIKNRLEQLDRVGRSLMHLTKVLAEIEAKRASFATVEDGVSTKGATGKLILHVLGAISEFGRGLIIERTQAGLAAARKRGRIGGRKRVMGPKETKRARALLGRVDLSANDVAAMMKVSRRSLFRHLQAPRDHDELVGTRR